VDSLEEEDEEEGEDVEDRDREVEEEEEEIVGLVESPLQEEQPPSQDKQQVLLSPDEEGEESRQFAVFSRASKRKFGARVHFRIH